jgi:hypothetical protein
MLLHGYRKFMKFAALQPAAHFDDLNRKRGGIIARDGARQIRFYCAELIFVYLPKDNLVSGAPSQQIPRCPHTDRSDIRK